MTNPFYRLSPFIREYIYKNKWNELRDVQTRAISAILDSDDHVLIAASTASGKTEAAFFPILSLMYDDKPASFGVLYIGPLKALINDQFERIYDLLAQADMPVFAWHGDRGTGEKSRALKTCRGVLQITPESLEALLMNRPGDVIKMLSDLRFVVIDEMHAFMGQDRGLQLLCQLGRIEKLTGRSARRIGLSATIHDYKAAGEWLGAGSSRGVNIIESRDGGRKLNLAMEHFGCANGADDAEKARVNYEYTAYLYDQVRGKKCIIFTNSRTESERTINALKDLAEKRGEPDNFFVHHGSLSASIRGETESALKNAQGPAVAAATRTLELGIDLGGLERVVQLGAPNTCSSFVQRLGRSGRRGAPANMRFITYENLRSDEAFDVIPWDLIQNIAVIQLYLEDRWVETPAVKPCPYSVLIHQTLSVLNQTSMKPPRLAQYVLTLPGLSQVDIEDYKTLLKYALEKEYIQKTDDGELIVGINAEVYTNSYKFYSVFQDTSGYKVFSKEREIGEIDSLPKINDILLLAGRKWRVIALDDKRGHVFVDAASASKAISWAGGGGDVDDRIAERMRRVLYEDAEYAYLQQGALEHLREARTVARSSGILQEPTWDGAGHIALHPWLGTRKMRTLHFLLTTTFKASLGVCAAYFKECHIDVVYDPATGDFLERLRDLLFNLKEDDIDLSSRKDAALYLDRYDALLPRTLLEKAYIRNLLDIPGIRSNLQGVIDEPRKEVTALRSGRSRS